eukprot:evm.model.scf_425EXC.13 EVM.evm.TU.scf_425EXC.13   scf_425EXC:81070-84097(+)
MIESLLLMSRLPDDADFSRGKDGVLKFRNWASTLKEVTVGRKEVAEPVTVQDIQNEVQSVLKARSEGQPNLHLRPVGRGHSWTPVFLDDGDWLLMSDKMRLDDNDTKVRIPTDEPLAADGIPLVEVAGGVNTWDLAVFMDDPENQAKLKYMGLPADVVLDTVRYGGVVNMACHGTAWNEGTIPDFVQRLSIVDGSGMLRKLDRDTTDPEEFRAAVANFGLFGITHSITFKLATDPERLATPSLLVEDRLVPMDTYFNAEGLTGTALKDLAKEKYSVEFFWFPLNGVDDKRRLSDWDAFTQDQLWVKTTDLSADMERNGKPRETFPDAASRFPSVTSFLARIGFQLNQFLQAKGNVGLYKQYSNFVLDQSVDEDDNPKLTSFAGGIHYQLGVDEVKVLDFEMAIKLDEDLTVVSQAWNAAVRIVKAYLRGERGEPKHPMNIALEFRFTGHSDALMSPAYGKHGDHFVWIEVLGVTESEGWQEFMKEIFDAWKVILGPNGERPKPHWAKWTPTEHEQLTEIGEYAKEVYADQIAEFNKQLSKYDSEGVFMNDFFRALGFGAGAQ